MPDRFVRLKILAAKFFTVTPRRLTTLVLSLVITVALNAPAVAAGPLRVNPVNSRYFFDADGATVFLAGSYQNPYNLLNGDSWDLASYFDYLAQHNHNFTRLWAWEQSPWMFDSNGQVTYSLQPFERTGSSAALDGGAKFDLARFNQAYFDQLRTRVIQAGQRGIYVSVILFEGFSSQRRVREVNPWLADPFQRDNNINGINADPNGNGRGEEFFSLNYPSLTALQEAFVRKVVDTLNDLDNVLYEISGDTLATSLVWQYHMIDYLKQYQSSKANQHPVGISQFYARKLAEVLNSRADWVVTQGTDFNPPVVNSNKVVFNEGHPVLFTYSNPDQWVWRAFTRGYNLIYPEAISDDAGVGERVHAAIGQSRAYSQFLNLRTMFPSTTLCSRDFCLGSQGSDYLVYLPSAGQVSIDLSAATVNFLTAWFDPVTGQTISGDSVSGGKRTTFTSPIRGQSVLQISPERLASGQTGSVSLNRLTPSTSNTLDFVESASASQEMVSTPMINPNGGIYSGSVRVSLSTKTQSATIYYTTDGKSPTQSSKKYTGAFTLTGSILVKAKAFKNGKNPSAESSAWFADINSTSAFNFTLANSGDKSVSTGSSTTTTITATLSSASSQSVSFTVSGLPSGATGAFSSVSCTPTCSSTLTVSTSGSTPAGNYQVSVSASGGGQTRTTSFNLSVSTAVSGIVAPPTLSPNGGSFAGPVSLTMQTATAGAAIYYTTDGSTPTLSSTPYSGAITVSTSSTIRAKAFKSGYSASAEASASFNISSVIGGSNLVAYWKFDEGMGTVAADSSGNGNNGTLVNGPMWSGGIAGNALYFDGTDDNVTVMDSNSLGLTSAFTLIAWVNPAAAFTDLRTILRKDDNYYLYASSTGFCGDGSILAAFGPGNMQQMQKVCDLTLAVNAWTHLVWIYDGSVLTLYRNGLAVASSNALTGPPLSTGVLKIGGSQYGENFQGLIDEVRVYNRALTSTEIQTIYQEALPFDYSLPNSSDRSVNAGSLVTNTISATLASGVPQAVSFSVSGLPSGAMGSFSSASCTLTCSTVLTISTSGSTLAGSYPITVTSAGGGLKRSTVFTLSVTLALTVATPSTTPNGGSFSGSVSVAMQSATSGSSIYYTTDGSTPTQSSTLYTGAMTLTSNATVNARAFKSGYNPSAVASASFTNSRSGTIGTGKIYYVAKTGSDSYSCSQAQSASTPRLTITGGISCLSSGDTLVVGTGTYTDSLEAVNIPGGSSWSAPTVIKRFGTDTVRIKPTSGNFVMSLETAQQHHIEFDGLIFDGTGGTTNSTVKITWSGAGPSNHAHHIRFRNSEFMSDGTGGRNGLLGGEDGLEVINSYFHDVDYGIYWGGKNALIEGTRFENGRGYALHFYCVSGCDTSNAVVRNNLMKNFGTGPACTAALLFANGTGHQAYNNEIVGQGGPCGGGIALYYSSGNTQIYNNTIHNNAGVCIDIAAGHSGAVVRDNICYQNGGNIRDNGNGTLLSNNVYN